MSRRIRTAVIWLAGVLVVALLAGALAWSLGKPQSLPPPPNLNGYDCFVQAGTLAVLPNAHFTELSHETLRAVIQTNGEALSLLRSGLTQRCVVPWSQVVADSTNGQTAFITALGGFKRLAQLLAAEGRLAEMEHRPAEAARSYLDCIRFGNEQSRGGPLISRLVGLACEAIGYQPLLTLLPQLSHAELRELARGLEEVRRASVPWDEVWRAERQYTTRHARSPFAWVIAYPQIVPAKLKAQQKDAAIVSKLTLLSVELALRCHQAEHGKPPEQLKELTPEFLKEIPPDPFNGKPLVYRPKGTTWVLYSVGPDRVDNGGVAVTRRGPNQVSIGPPFLSIPVPAGDVFHDSVW